MRQFRLIALLSEPATKSGPLEGPPLARGHKREVVAWRSHDDGRKVGVDWNDQFGPGLLLLHAKSAIADVLRPHADHIASALPRVKEKSQRQPSPSAHWMVPLELGNLIIRPAMVALALDAYRPHLTSGSSARRPIWIACFIMTRRAMRNPLAAPGC
jgi:hypothetical protein